MAHHYTVFVLWILIQCFDEAWSWEAVVVKSSVFARDGYPAELPCSYTTLISPGFTLEWRYAAPGTPAVHAERVLYYNGRLYWADSWEQRMVLVQNPPVYGVASVKILNVQPSDSGLYICDVTNPNNWAGSGQGLINLTVLVAPSVPECQLTGSTYVGDDVTLTCRSSEGFPTPIYSWSREMSEPLPSSSVVEDRHTGALILTNLSAAFAGTYICHASNALGVEACSVAVKVAHGGDAALVGGVLMGVFLLLLLVGAVTTHFLCYKKRPQRHAENHFRMIMDPSERRQSKGSLLSANLSDGHPQQLRVSHFSPLV